MAELLNNQALIAQSNRDVEVTTFPSLHPALSCPTTHSPCPMLLLRLHVACDSSQVLLGYESRVWEGETDMDGGLYSRPPRPPPTARS
jgi:hypothetical protein